MASTKQKFQAPSGIAEACASSEPEHDKGPEEADIIRIDLKPHSSLRETRVHASRQACLFSCARPKTLPSSLHRQAVTISPSTVRPRCVLFCPESNRSNQSQQANASPAGFIVKQHREVLRRMPLAA